MALKSIGEASKKLLMEAVSLLNIHFIFTNFSSFTEVEAAVRFLSLSVSISRVCTVQIPPANKSFQEAQNELNQTAADLNQSAGEVVTATRGSSSQLAVASGKFSQDFDEFLDAGIEMAGHTQVCLIVYQFHSSINLVEQDFQIIR